MKLQLEKLGTAGAIFTAILCPVCFPKLALIGAVLGLGVLAPFEAWFATAAQGFLILSLVGHSIAYRRHRNIWVVVLAGLSVALILGSLWLHYVEALVYLGLVGVVVATTWSMFALRKPVACEASAR